MLPAATTGPVLVTRVLPCCGVRIALSGKGKDRLSTHIEYPNGDYISGQIGTPYLALP